MPNKQHPTKQMKKFNIPKLKKLIIHKVLEGTSLSDITTKGNAHELTAKRVYQWLNSDESFRNQYILARKTQVLFTAEQMMFEIKKVEELPPDKLNRFVVDLLNTKLNTMRFIASKLLPKVYGTDIQVNNNFINVNPIQNMIVIDSQAQQSLDTHEQLAIE